MEADELSAGPGPYAAIRRIVRRGWCVMAIQDYVKSLAATEVVSKDQVFRFLEIQFARADRNHDGQLDVDELAAFVHAVSCPESDQR
jgi:EF hand